MRKWGNDWGAERAFAAAPPSPLAASSMHTISCVLSLMSAFARGVPTQSGLLSPVGERSGSGDAKRRDGWGHAGARVRGLREIGASSSHLASCAVPGPATRFRLSAERAFRPRPFQSRLRRGHLPLRGRERGSARSCGSFRRRGKGNDVNRPSLEGEGVPSRPRSPGAETGFLLPPPARIRSPFPPRPHPSFPRTPAPRSVPAPGGEIFSVEVA